jgi:uncharacterized protein
MPEASPLNYPELVKYLVLPFLESPDTLKMDCETYGDQAKLWIRLALDESDKDRLVGRNGRNIQAIRRVIDVAAKPSGARVQLEVYGVERPSRPPSSSSNPSSSSRPRPRRPRR